VPGKDTRCAAVNKTTGKRALRPKVAEGYLLNPQNILNPLKTVIFNLWIPSPLNAEYLAFQAGLGCFWRRIDWAPLFCANNLSVHRWG
jgi:hypothetical protein